MGLYVHNPVEVSKVGTNNNLKTLYDYSFVTTVARLESEFSKRDVEQAKLARVLHCCLGHPNMQKYYSLLKNNTIQNCQFTVRDAKMFNYIYGPIPASLKGKTTRCKPLPVPTHDTIPIPPTVREFYYNITLHIGIFFVLGLPFFHTISDHYNFCTVEELSDRKYMSILSCFQNVVNIYNARGLTISNVRGDSEFLCISTSILPALFHVTAMGEHIPKVERSIRASTIHHLWTSLHKVPCDYGAFSPAPLHTIVNHVSVEL